MYSERAKFKFSESVIQSDRFRFLARLANELEQAGQKYEESPGFSIEQNSNGHVKIVIWQFGKSEVLWQQLHMGESLKIIKVTTPKNFSEWENEYGDYDT